MIKWFYRWLDNKIQNSRYEDDEVAPATLSSNRARARNKISTVRESDEMVTEPIQFKMFKAAGGWAVEFRQYDHRNDRVDSSLYVINDEEELGNHIAKIITMEALKR